MIYLLQIWITNATLPDPSSGHSCGSFVATQSLFTQLTEQEDIVQMQQEVLLPLNLCGLLYECSNCCWWLIFIYEGLREVSWYLCIVTCNFLVLFYESDIPYSPCFATVTCYYVLSLIRDANWPRTIHLSLSFDFAGPSCLLYTSRV
jgi:hypothetical protein